MVHSMIPEQIMETKCPETRSSLISTSTPQSPLFLIMGSEQTIGISDSSQPPAVAN